MQAFRFSRFSALVIVFSLAAPYGQAGTITPESIPNPPNAVASAQGTPVYPSSFVSSQYKGLGLNFRSGAAITNLSGTSVWAATEGLGQPASSGFGIPPGNYPTAQLNFSSLLSGSIVSLGSLNATTVSSLSVVILGNGSFPLPLLSMHVFGANGQILPITPRIGNILSEQDWTFTGPGISSFSVVPTITSSTPWGIASVSFTPATAPEPSSLILAGLGALALATRLGWRRIRRTVRLSTVD